MEDQAPYVAGVAYPEALVPYVAALVAEGFKPEDWSPSGQPCLYATWEPKPQVYYFCDLVVVETEVHAWLVRKRTGEQACRLFHWMRVDTPEELRWLLQHAVHLTQARANAEDELENRALPETTPRAPAGQLPCRLGVAQSVANSPDAAAARG